MALQTLNLFRNEFTTLPESFGQLVALQKLDLCDNQLMTLPESFSQLVALGHLNLSGTGSSKLEELEHTSTPPTQKFYFWPRRAPGPTQNSGAHRGEPIPPIPVEIRCNRTDFGPKNGLAHVCSSLPRYFVEERGGFRGGR